MQNGNHFRIREADANRDAAAILSIYSPFVTSSTTSLEFKIPTESEMKHRIRNAQQSFPWLICEATDHEDTEVNGIQCIAGYAYASRHRDREGYQWIAETGIYLAESYRGQGVGAILYNKLCTILSQQGYFQALAIISRENEGSIAFHKQMGFQLLGTWKNCGNKFGKWCDICWYSKQLQSKIVDNPPAPLPYPQVKHLY